MGIFESKEEKKRRLLAKEERKFDAIKDAFGVTELSPEDMYYIYQLGSNMGIDSFTDYPYWQLTKADTKAEEQMMKWEWLITRQNWLILNQLAKLNNNIEKLIKNND